MNVCHLVPSSHRPLTETDSCLCAPRQVNFYYGAPTPYAESIAPSHHSNYAHYYDEEDEAWEMPNFYNEAFVRGQCYGRALPAPKLASTGEKEARCCIVGITRFGTLQQKCGFYEPTLAVKKIY